MDVKFFKNEPTKQDIIIYLHGGPFFQINKESDDPIIGFLLDNGYKVYVINYLENSDPTSTNPIWGNGGVVDFSFVLQAVQKLIKKHINNNIFVVGESYGGYLASLLANTSLRIRKIIVISGFISIDYQFLFSSENRWLKQLLSKKAYDFNSLLNDIKIPIVFIQGSLDITSPIQQFSLVEEIVPVYKLSGFRHREEGQKLNAVYEIVRSNLL